MQPIIDYLIEQSVPVDKYLQQLGIPTRLAGKQTASIPRKFLSQFVNDVCLAEGLEDIGLLAGRAASLHMMGDFGQLLLNTHDVGDYLNKGCASINTAVSSHYYWLTEEPESVRFCQFISDLDTRNKTQDYLLTSLITINTIRDVVGDGWCPAEINIPDMIQATADKLVAHLPGTNVITEGRHAFFTVPVAVLRCPMSPGVVPIASPKCKLSEASLPQDLTASIVRIIELQIATGQPDIASTADVAGLTARTLQRRLMDSGKSYTDLLAQTRIRLAKQWIRDDRRSLEDIAEALGYKNPSNFSRSFRRITGLSPRAYRSSIAQILLS